MYGIVATQTVKPGNADEYIACFERLKAVVQANEPGVVYYDLYRSRSDENTFHFMEKYDSKDAIKAHGQSPEFLALFKILNTLAIDPPEAQIVKSC